ncbi:MAG: hypothetical protein IPJ87_00145 [Flavobacteriales bacterium]|nr:hypothetical protein [Flavobacteriales bacterium]
MTTSKSIQRRATLAATGRTWKRTLPFTGQRLLLTIRHYLTAEGQRAATAQLNASDGMKRAALLGYLFNELERLKYITPPQRKENGELKTNWAAVARIPSLRV